MIQGIEAGSAIKFPYPPQSQNQAGGGFNNYNIEDKAIISSQARLLNELEKYNAGEGNEVDLAIACSECEITVEAMAKIIKTKDEMAETILDMI